MIGALAAVYGFVAVAAAALGAHVVVLEGKPLAWFDTATRLLMFHALALLLLSAQIRQRPVLLLRWIALGMNLGVWLFCGALYALAFGAPRALAHLAPIGGSALMLSWLLWFWAHLRLRL